MSANTLIMFSVQGGGGSPALAMQRRVARRQGLGLAVLNRLLAHWVVLRLRWGQA
jgi:spermidine synthase